MNILLVDDHDLVLRGLKSYLVEELPGVTLTEARNAKEARALIPQVAWTLVLLDINLPGGSGFELLDDGRRLCPAPPMLVISAYPEAEFAIRALKLGASGYLTKSSMAEEMLVAVRRVLAGGKYVSTSLAETLATALGNPLHQSPHEALSARELEVLRRVAVGQSIKEIASQLSLSEKTIGTYRTRISSKIGISTNVALTRYALKHGLVEGE